MNELMGELVDALNQWHSSNDVGASFFLSTLSKIIGAIQPPTITSVAQDFIGAMNDAVAAAAKNETDSGNSGFGYNGSESDGVYQMLKSYIEAGNKVCQQAVDVVDGLVADVKVLHGDQDSEQPTSNWVSVPDWNVPCAPHQ